jgi:hypothetical protein
MSVQMSQVLTTARTYLNDDNAIQFPDPVIIPKVQEAHRELQEELWVAGSPNVRGQTSVLTVLNGVKTLNQTSTPALPTDFLCPTAMFESAASTGPFAPMTEAFYIPLGYTPVATLSWWSWQQENIVLGGASGTVYVIAQYRHLITIPVLSTDLIGILFGESYLAARAAAIVAGAVGNKEVYAAMTALAKENLAKVLTANRGQQKPLLKP